MTIRPLPLIVAFAVLLVSGLAHGVWTQRWQPARELEEACTRLYAVPMGAGPWQSSNIEADPEAFHQARAAAYWMRRYSKDGDSPITVILMCGRAGHMAVHTPDICYRGAGYVMMGEPGKEMFTFVGQGSSAPGRPPVADSRQPSAEFWSARFRQAQGSATGELRIFWAWSTNGSWQAPASPRWTFGGDLFLYKLYVVRDGAVVDSKTVQFMRELLPVLEKSLFTH